MGGFWILAIQNLGGGVVSDSITISTPTQYQIHQRDGSDEADIAITVDWTGSPAGIEARFNGGDWQTIDASPTGGASSGTLSAQSAGQGTLEVRFTNDTDVNDSVTDIGIGDVFLTAGQSNANGWLDNYQSYSHGSLTAVMWTRDGSAWEELADPTGYITTEYGSLWPLLATQHMADQGVPVGFICMAQNGNGLVDGPWDPGNPGASYTATVARIAEAGINDLAAVLWDQGERTATNDETQQDWEDTFDLLVSSFASDTGIDPPWIVAQTGTTPAAASAAALNNVRAAQVSRWENNAKVYPGPVGYDRADIHWTSDAEAAIVTGRWWAAIDAAIFDGSNSRGPQVSAAVETVDRTQIRVTFSATLDTGLTLETDPWEVDDDGTPATISSISYSGAIVTLTLSTALTGSATTVSLGSGNLGAGHVVPRGADITLPDATTANQPAEPFVAYAVSAAASGSFNQLMGRFDFSEDADAVSWHTFQDDAASTDVVDTFSGAQTATLVGDNTEDATTTGPNSYYTKALDFDGTRYVDMGIASRTNFTGASKATIACWFKTSQTGMMQLFGCDNAGDLRLYCYLNRGSANPQQDAIRVELRNTGLEDSVIAYVTGTGLSDGEWHSFILTLDPVGNTLGFRVDDTDYTPTYVREVHGSVFPDFGDNLYVGAANQIGTAIDHFTGQIAGFTMFTGEWTDAEKAQWADGPELNYNGTATLAENGAYDLDTVTLPAPFASGANGSVTHEVVAVNAAGDVLDTASGAMGTLDLSGAYGSTCYLLSRASNLGDYDIGDSGTRVSAYGEASDGYYELVSVLATTSASILATAPRIESQSTVPYLGSHSLVEQL